MSPDSSRATVSLAAGRAPMAGLVPASGFTSFLSRSLVALERERPDIALRLAATLAALEVTLHVGDERVRIWSDGHRTLCEAAEHDSAVVLESDRATLLALVDGELAFLDAVLSERLRLRGAPADLVRFQDALEVYLRGAVRAPSFRELLRELRLAW